MRIAALLATTTLLYSVLLNGVAFAAPSVANVGPLLESVPGGFGGKPVGVQGTPEPGELDRGIRPFGPVRGTVIMLRTWQGDHG